MIKLIYIASPLKGDVDENLFKAAYYCKWAVRQSVVPLAPHLIFTQFLSDDMPDERRLGMQMGLALMSTCQEVWFLGDVMTDGMMEELNHALTLKKKIRFISESEIETGRVYENSHR